jgi:hypothetical protein
MARCRTGDTPTSTVRAATAGRGSTGTRVARPERRKGQAKDATQPCRGATRHRRWLLADRLAPQREHLLRIEGRDHEKLLDSRLGGPLRFER